MKPKYLLQRKESGEEYVFPYTHLLAQRSDMKPMTQEQYEDWKKADALGFDEVDVDEEPEVEPEKTNDRNILEELKDREEVANKSQAMLEQEDILKIETEKVNRFRKTATLEAYILEKYKLSMVPGDLEFMKSQAIEFIEDLAKKGRLYTVAED